MVQVIRQKTLIPGLDDGSSLSFGEPNTGVAIANSNHVVRKAVLKLLTDFTVAVAQADDFGSTKLMDLPDTNLLLLGVEVDCTITKGGTTNGLVAATDLDVGIGTAAASASTLATTMIDIIEKADLNADTITAEFEAHTNNQATATFPKVIADGASTALYFNVAAAITADDSLTVDGTITIFYIDLGNMSS